MKIQLPEQPVDKHKVIAHLVDAQSGIERIDKIEYVYHVNTPWNEFDTSRPGGADIVNDWMVYCNGSLCGRIDGWNRIREFLSADCFYEDYKSASTELTRIMNVKIEHHRIEIDRLNTLIRALKK